MATKDSSPRYESLGAAGTGDGANEFEDEELRMLGKLHVDQSKWLPQFSSPAIVNAGTIMLSDVYWTHKDVVFYSNMCFGCALLGILLMIVTKQLYWIWFDPIYLTQYELPGPTQLQYNVYTVVTFANTFVTIIQIFSIYGCDFVRRR